MNGHVPDERLQDYVDGRLPAADKAAVEAHLAGCADCAAQLDALRALLARVAALPREIQPARDLLPALHARLEHRPLGARSLHSLRYPLAAAAALLVVSTMLATLAITGTRRGDAGRSSQSVAGRSGGPTPRPEGTDAPGGTTFNGAAVPVGLPPRLAAEVARYGDAIGELQHTLDRQRAELSPQTVEVLERNLRVIDAALAESREALARDPQNPVLERMILSTYEQKLRLLRRAAEAATS